MAENLIVRSKIKGAVSDVNVSGAFYDALNEKLIEVINKAVERAKANGRKTVKPIDL